MFGERACDFLSECIDICVGLELDVGIAFPGPAADLLFSEDLDGRDQIELHVCVMRKVVYDSSDFEVSNIVKPEDFPHRVFCAKIFMGCVLCEDD